MDQRRLEEHLAALHEELLASGPVDTKNRDLLQRLAGDVRALLDATPGATDRARYQALSDRLKEATGSFEASHPRLTAAMVRVIDTLVFYNL